MDSNQVNEFTNNSPLNDCNSKSDTFSKMITNAMSDDSSIPGNDTDRKNGDIEKIEADQSILNTVLQVHKDTATDGSLSIALTAKQQPMETNTGTSFLSSEVNVENTHKIISTTNVTMATTESLPGESIGEVNHQNNSATLDKDRVNYLMPAPSVDSRKAAEILHNNEITNPEQDNVSNCNLSESDKIDVPIEDLHKEELPAVEAVPQQDNVSNCLVNLSDKIDVPHVEDLPAVKAVPEMDIDKQSTVGVTTIVVEDINIKQEPLDEGYGKVELLHRGQPIVVYSDDDNDTDNSSSYVPPIQDRLKELEEFSDEETEKKLTSTKLSLLKNKSRTEGEVFPEELPPMEYLMISPDESVELEPLGVVSGIVDVLVVVKADNNSPALYDDTILFVEGRKPLGLIFETFGTVEKPYYSVRFNSAADIEEKSIEVGHRVYFAPKADNLTKYVFIAELRKVKCDDASWKNDNEVPAAHRDYSDDEEERKEKRRAKNKERGNTDSDSVADNSVRRKKKKWPGQDSVADSDPTRPRLLPGKLMRNPFGGEGQRFNAASSNQWPPPRHNSNNGPRGPRDRSPLSVPPPPPAPHMFHTPPPRLRPPVASFGQNPRWTSQSNAPPFPGPPPFPEVNGLSAGGHSPFSAPTPHSFAPMGQPRFTGSHMPTFSSPCPPRFRPVKDTPGMQSTATPSSPSPSFPPPQWSPSVSPQFPPPPPFFGIRPANFNPSMPPPPPFGSKSPQVFPTFPPSQPPVSNNRQGYHQSNS